MFHDQRVNLRLCNDWCEKLADLADEKPDKYENVSHVVRVFIAEGLRRHGKLPQEQRIKSYEGKVMKDE